MTLAVNIAQSGSNNVTFRNRIINGAMVIDQRNAGAVLTLAASGSGYPVDRMRVSNQTDGTLTAQQSSTVPAGFTNAIVLTVTATDTSIGATQYAQLEQRVEGFNVADLGWGTANAQSVTLSFWVRSSLTGTFCATTYNSNGSRCYVATYTINSANTYEYKTITIAGDTSGTWQTGSSTGINLIFTLAVGSTYQQAAGAWGTTSFAIGTSGQTNFMGTNGATFYITGVQLEAGTTASPFEYRQYGTELALCQRYCFTITGNSGEIVGIGFTGTVAAGTIGVAFPVEMRTSPTLVSSLININDSQAQYTGSAVVLSYAGTPKFNALNVTITGGTIGRGCQGYWAASSSKAVFSSEL